MPPLKFLVRLFAEVILKNFQNVSHPLPDPFQSLIATTPRFIIDTCEQGVQRGKLPVEMIDEVCFHSGQLLCPDLSSVASAYTCLGALPADNVPSVLSLQVIAE
jgi:hypothetical protein